MKPYYLAYNERYKTIHEGGNTWFTDLPTPELLDWIRFYDIPKPDRICEVGCGEGRDAIYISGLGYKVTAVDASEAAIRKCNELATLKGQDINFLVADALYLDQNVPDRYQWMYTIATLHMLVEDIDRHNFLKSLYNRLADDGKLLLISMGDGVSERSSDINTAFDLQERVNGVTGETVMVAGTSYRAINWEHHKMELQEVGFSIERELITENHEYGKCMTVYLSRG